ncbi:hypothetical protein I3843_06G037200 [Carya illinoinensis]|uniref:DUF7725 domain-containing protein n=1 Tax=Carya illinoinensis TaxID=32201 RepID=A0A922ERW6_CARIL|nr:hypothetical protein I3760_06G040900 [Carya illinoinensis]KAG6707622.1 hypothetical protein I3842_06G041600 [Carya illinoinensis]KAG7974213.1 hypothetical protein I3843_06G037200 [Carya illinoinensis]
MEVPALVAASATTHGGSLSLQPPSSSPSSRKEWSAVSEHRNAGDEELEQSKLAQTDERTIYEVQQGREPLDVDFCSITVNGSLDDELLLHRLHNFARQREELQRAEIELRAQIVARSEMMGMQSNFDAQMKEHAISAAKLQEQLREREKTIHELERKMEEKDRELHAIKLDNEVAWAQEDRFREQDKELASFRRERDHSEAERAQHIKQIHDLQEHFQEKERQIFELQDQHRVAQETLIYKDEQLRETQAWIAHVQEMDVLQSTTTHSLQAELRERTEQYNQLWLGCQRQFAEMERIHLHTIQQLQLELTDARERSGTYGDESGLSQKNSKDVSQFGQGNGNELDADGGGTSGGNSGVLSSGNSGSASSGNPSTQAEYISSVPLAPPSLLGMPTYLQPGQVTALHPSYVMHQQGVPHSLPLHVPSSHVGQFHSIPAMGSLQQWQNQQAVSEGLQIATHNELPPSQTDQSMVRSDANYSYEMPVNGQALRQDYLDVHIGHGPNPDSEVLSSSGEAQALESSDGGYVAAPKPEQSLHQISSQSHDAVRLDSLDQNSENKNLLTSTNHGLEGQSTAEGPSSVTNPSVSDNSIHSVNLSETTVNSASAALPESFVSTGQSNILTAGKASEPALLDERSLLACIVRTIPAGGQVRISSTLPNRLGKMLAPLHWHDYKKKYGKLDDFVFGHPELFMIEGDYIQLREGAQEMIAAEAAVAKVAAAAAASSPYSSILPSMAVTPVAQPHRLRKVPSMEYKNLKTDKTAFKEYASISPNSTDEPSQLTLTQNQQSNGVGFGLSRGLLNMQILSKPKDPQEMNGPENRAVQSTFVTVGNGANVSNRSSLNGTQRAGPANGRANLNFVGKQQGRMTGAVFSSRR